MSGTFHGVIHGDCLQVMAEELELEEIDAIVTDPPYGLGFMGKQWDHGVPGVPFWTEALKVSKPGAHLVAFGGSRTFHRLTVAIEDAGWEIRDALLWLYGSGFPKSRDLGDGRGTALKPAWEPIVLARKPFRGTVTANVAELGTGGLNIDACRIGDADTRAPAPRMTSKGSDGGSFASGAVTVRSGELAGSACGRWPANVMLDEAAAAQLDEQTGELQSGNPGTMRLRVNSSHAFGSESRAIGTPMTGYGDVGGASRFFYTAKASRSERDEGLEGSPKRSGGSNAAGFTVDVANGIDRNRPVHNFHPTVKPLEVMRWLCRLITPPGGLILDPFTGSGSTGCAALSEGFGFVGIELDADFAEIARQRILHHGRQMTLGL